MKTEIPVLLAIMVVGVGVILAPPLGGEQAAQADGQDTPDVDNPWDRRTVVVGLADTGSDRDYEGMAAEAVEFWNRDRVSSFGDYPADLVFRPDAEDPDIEIRVVSDLSMCGNSYIPGGYLGCAHRLEADSEPTDPEVVEISSAQTDSETVNTLKHELGHVLGIDHDGKPSWIMALSDDSVQALNATERASPWNDTDVLKVYVGDGFDDPSVERDVESAVMYYRSNPEYLPPNTSIRMVDDWHEADIIFQDHAEDDDPYNVTVSTTAQSSITVYGLDWDRDDSLELYSVAYIHLSQPEDLDVENHAGHWIGLLSNNDEDELPERYR